MIEFKDFLQEFKQRKAAVAIESTDAFAALCDALEQENFKQWNYEDNTQSLYAYSIGAAARDFPWLCIDTINKHRLTGSMDFRSHRYKAEDIHLTNDNDLNEAARLLYGE